MKIYKTLSSEKAEMAFHLGLILTPKTDYKASLDSHGYTVMTNSKDQGTTTTDSVQ